MKTRPVRCASKASYLSWTEAELAAQDLISDLQDGKLRLQKGGVVLAYQCQVCQQWHIGHSGFSQKRLKFYPTTHDRDALHWLRGKN